jgi:uncharacterized C2H2 Zn-finger protein
MERSIVRRCGHCGKWFNATKAAQKLVNEAPEVQRVLAAFSGSRVSEVSAVQCPRCGTENSLEPPVNLSATAAR